MLLSPLVTFGQALLAGAAAAVGTLAVSLVSGGLIRVYQRGDNGNSDKDVKNSGCKNRI